MAKKSHASEPGQGKGSDRNQGSGEHGWSPDVDETRQQDNPSAQRSFHTAEHGGGKGPGRTKSAEETKAVLGDTVESRSARGEERSGEGGQGRRDTGRKGHSQRPSGTKDASAFTGVDPQEPPSRRRPG